MSRTYALRSGNETIVLAHIVRYGRGLREGGPVSPVRFLELELVSGRVLTFEDHDGALGALLDKLFEPLVAP